MVRRLSDRLQAAAAQVDLTPAAGTTMGGYMQRGDQTARGTHDPLEGAILWLHIPGTPRRDFVWVAIDAVAVDHELSRRIARALADRIGADPDGVVVCASHSHSGPAGWLKDLPHGLGEREDEPMRAELVDRLAQAAASLPRALQPVRPVFGEGRASGVGANRNDPRGPHDDSFGVLGLLDAAGQVRALVLDYASHPTVLGHDNLLWSADYPGAARRGLVSALSALGLGEPVVIFLQGAAGDVSSRFVRRAQDFTEVSRLGGLLAASVLRCLLEARVEESRGTPLRWFRETVQLPTRLLPSPARASAQVDAAAAAWRGIAARQERTPEERIARTRYEGALLLARLASSGLPPTIDLPVSVAVLHETAWVHLPVELFASLGLAIRDASPFRRTRVIGYADGYAGYVADTAGFEGGVYEAASSLFDAAGGRQLVNAVTGFVAGVHASLEPEAVTIAD
ncbi:MAG TPA: neutral/alkaline non-lysosomal ceramidase N-terminal domain-containing protein [Candidatus Sulfotelmatobacter sp.]|nr:neutral/alkaline non-lysosomal ceramidase N-terminal domain-containing protein [Candidatus Sulfotelmatobacter sp.]